MSNRLKTFDHIGVVVQDLEESIAWYAKHLGFEHQSGFEFPGAKVAFIARGSLRLELFQIEGASPMATERKEAVSNLSIGGINHFAIVVDDLDKTVAELQADGVELAYTVNDVPDGSGDRWTFIRDNEGMLIELYQPAS
ncbi:bleomycin resistance protein [Erythrobacter litoralis]|uniref:VOC family protein n=1 Tax=Erythrobacter litoralis TaxID=39960 RepID=UPI00243550E3|nr:VOC family protein [Erythrobacter litoralis]MDG6080272.1 bleomycin resistance protein [Erythrobacter litoralis]